MRLKVALCLVCMLAVLVPLSTANARTAPSYRVTATVSTSNVTVGASLILRGSVTPTASGKYVVVQAQQPGSSVWRTVATARLNRASRYSVRVRPRSAGVTRYRVIKAHDSRYGRGVSPVRAVTGWRWRSFESMFLNIVQDSGTTKVSSVNLGGHTYSPGYVQTPQGDRFFHLGGQCSRIDAWVGVDPGSPTNDAEAALLDGALAGNDTSFGDRLASPLVHRDGSPVHIVLGPAQVVPVVNLEMYFNGFTPPGNSMDWGAPRAYCKF